MRGNDLVIGARGIQLNILVALSLLGCVLVFSLGLTAYERALTKSEPHIARQIGVKNLNNESPVTVFKAPDFDFPNTFLRNLANSFALSVIIYFIVWMLVLRKIRHLYFRTHRFIEGDTESMIATEAPLGQFTHNEIDKLAQHLDRIRMQARFNRLHEAQLHGKFAIAMEGASDGMWVYNPSGQEAKYSARWYGMMGLKDSARQPNLDTWYQRVHPEDLPKIKTRMEQLIDGDIDSFEQIHRLISANEQPLWMLVRGVATRNADGQTQFVGGSFSDLTAIKEAENDIEEEKLKSQTILNYLNDAIICTDQLSHIVFMNPVAEKLTGWSLEEVLGTPVRHVFKIVTEFNREPLTTPLDRCLEQNCQIGLSNHILVPKQGDDILIEDRASAFRNAQNEITGGVMIFRDISGARKLTQQISYQASHDELTGLFNRREFERRLKIAVISAKRGVSAHCMLYMDVDQFKVINDTCGHLAGDQLLREIAPIIQARVREGDILARLGGDEFGLLLNENSLEQATRIAQKLRSDFNDFRFHWHSETFEVSISIGVVPIIAESKDVTDIMRRADSACFAAKDAGRNRIHVYDANDQAMTLREGEMAWVSKLTDALENDRFLLYQQTIKPLHDSDESGEHYEILLRLHDEAGALVPPYLFLQAAERYNLIHKVDRWVVQHVFKWLASHPQALDRLAICSINLSGYSLSDQSLAIYINEQFEAFNIPPEKICFEITETMAVQHLDVARQLILNLKAKGARFALDDFGTGMSSFAYLKELPVDFLKIDGTFVKDILTDPIDFSMVKSINEIGHVMGKKTIAEFVENKEIMEKLRENGIDYAQGFGIDLPKPLAE